ncbi:MAG: response regulator [Desulfobacterales bacterium]|nr:response regulator [Desulfobacterales bacterium]
MKCEPTNVLLIEDEEAHADLTQRAIRKAGNVNRIDVVTHGEEALDYIFNRGKYADSAKYPLPCLILLDIRLPGMDGIEVLKQIKEHPDLKKLPVVMLTTSQRDDDIIASYGNHANSYVTKPTGLKQFEEKIRQLDFYWILINEPPVGDG